MTRRLINLSVVFALLTGCWGGVLADAACPHVECVTAEAAPEGAAGQAHDAVTSAAHSGHAAEHGGHAPAPPARDISVQGPTGSTDVSNVGHDLGCIHCVGRPEAPPTPNIEVRANTARKGEESAAPPAAARLEAPAAIFPREITPAQHAPPAGIVRHLLLSVFRI